MSKKNLGVKALSLMLVLMMLMSVCAPTIGAAVSTAEDSHINYVSIGDSMTNGYGFEGYYQGNKTTDQYDFMTGEGVYGADAYPMQFEKYLEGKGYTVNHTKLAPSALLADDLLFLLGGSDELSDNDWAGFEDYVGNYTVDQLKPYFQNAVAEADIITMCIGNASFGAYLVQQVTEVIGILGGTPEVDEQLTLENGLALLESEEAKKAVLEIYNEMKAELAVYAGVLPENIDKLATSLRREAALLARDTNQG